MVVPSRWSILVQVNKHDPKLGEFRHPDEELVAVSQD